MTQNSLNLRPFPPDYRASGLLLHVTSLPSPYGIGDVGPSALSWVDRLAEAGQSWWQVLPLGPTGYGNSPYQPLSSFAGDMLFISPDWLVEDGLLQAKDCQGRSFPQNKTDYSTVIPFKHELLDKVWTNFKSGARTDLRPVLEMFRKDQAHWLDDYALFRALKFKFGGKYYLEWPEEFVQRQTSAIDQARHELRDQIDEVCFAQFLLFRQTDRLKAYARGKGIGLIGDMPFYVSADSSDVWAHPEFFLLDQKRRPRVVAGVPPDYFSADGQLWGNPVYDWEALRKSGYCWCIDRLRALLAHVDVIRLDHFRGVVAAWHVPAEASTARTGSWVAGPGADYVLAAQRELGSLPFIVEDLGLITPDVYVLRDQFHLPGTRVLQFAFDGGRDNPHLPRNYVPNTVAYTATHDNPTTRGWFEELPESQRQIVWNYLKRPPGESKDAAPMLMESAWSSVAALSMAPLQDLLNLDNEARMNVPGHADGNWIWRCTPEMLSDGAFEWLRNLTRNTNRLGNTASFQTTSALAAGSQNLGRRFD
jgi:4-alpha-glucanotransferase